MHINICVCICMCAYTYVCMYVHTCYVLISPPMPIHHVLAAVFASCFYVLIYLLQDTHTHTHTHTHTQTHTHTHKNTQDTGVGRRQQLNGHSLQERLVRHLDRAIKVEQFLLAEGHERQPLLTIAISDSNSDLGRRAAFVTNFKRRALLDTDGILNAWLESANAKVAVDVCCRLH